MAQFVVRNLEDDVRDKLRALAQRQGQSMEEAVREILRGAVMRPQTPQIALGTRLAQRFARVGLTGEIPEVRGNVIAPPSFDR